MPLARILQACDAAVGLIVANWNKSATPMDTEEGDGVTRVYAPPISFTPDSPPQIAGRQVFVFPGPYDAANFTRVDQLRDYKIRVLVVEQYTADTDGPPTAWIDDRVSFCEQLIFNPFANSELVLFDQCFPALEDQATVDVLYDAKQLLENKAFWCEMSFPFQEDTLQDGSVSL